VTASQCLSWSAAIALILGCAAGCRGPLDAAPASAAATPTVNTSSPAPTTAAAAALAGLEVKGRAPKTGYTRKQFGQAWSDDVDVPSGKNGCDQRSDILRRDLTAPTIAAGTHGCIPTAGTLDDPYTGRTIRFVRGAATSAAVQVDHVVALSDSWQTGGAQLPTDQRRNLAGDPLELLAVDGPTNQAKGDGDAATWLPPNKAFRCIYVERQIAVKAKYRLWVTPAEKAAMAAVLGSCAGAALPTEQTVAVPALNRGG